MDPSQNKKIGIYHQPQMFVHHLQELRKRILSIAAAFLVGGVIGYLVHNPIINLLKHPYSGTLYYGTPAGGFNFIMKICLLAGVLLATPVFTYNLIRFIQPALKEDMLRKSVRRLTLLSMLLAASGIIFAYWIIVPMSLHFFQGFKIAGVQPLISADSYLSFVISSLVTFIIVFQIPLIMTFIDRIKPMPPRKMLSYEKYVIVGALALAVVLPFTYDPITQFVVAIPIIVLYNLSILMIYASHRRRRTHIVQEPLFTNLIAEPAVIQPGLVLPVQAFHQTASVKARSVLIQDVMVKPKTRLNYQM